jgi:hypothetical protein
MPQQQTEPDFEICDGTYLSDLADEAVGAIVALWDPELKTFWRSTDHQKEKGQTKETFFPTVTIRCIEALLRYVEDFSRPSRPEISALVCEACSALLGKDEKDLHSTLGLTSGTGMLNPFTLSLYVAVLSKAALCNMLSAAHQELAHSRLRVACGHLLSYSPSSIGKGPEVHPFVLFHMVRSAISAQSIIKDAEIKSKLHELVSKTVQELETPIKDLLAKYTVGLLNPSEAVALAFCAACLEFLGDINDESYAASCLRVSTLFQDTSGCWPLGRLVPENEKTRQSRDLQIPTYEIAWAVTEAVSQMLAKRRQRPNAPFVTEIFRKLELAAKYAVGSAVTLEGPIVRGWCSDHAYGKPMIESWTSATVLQQALSMSGLVEVRNRAAVISKFSYVDPHDPDWPAWLHWDTFKKTSEPEEAYKVLDYLERKLIQPILEDPGKLPRPQNKNMSALLFGPPGTSKTTVVKALAQKLGWPLVMLSPGTFIERGLEYIEAQAKIVFDQLLQLARTFVLFDECDELFRAREPLKSTEQVRGITAFVTASMLPKLQDLHDRGKVVFFICTNHIESMDPAVKRGGRVDHIVAVGPPDSAGRRRIIELVLKKIAAEPHVRAAVNELVLKTERFTRGEVERIAAQITPPFENENAAKQQVCDLVARFEPSLVISKEEYESFLKQKVSFSHPHIEVP